MEALCRAKAAKAKTMAAAAMVRCMMSTAPPVLSDVREPTQARTGPTIPASRGAARAGNGVAHDRNSDSTDAASTEEDRSVASLAFHLQGGGEGADRSARRDGHCTGTSRAQAALRSHAAPGAEEGSR